MCWAISALAFLGLAVWFLLGVTSLGLGWNIGGGTFMPVSEHHVSADGLDSLSIDWTAGAVYIGTHSGNEIQITEFARRELRDNEHLSLSTNNGTLEIFFTEHSRRSSFTVNNNMQAKRLEVLIPYTLGENFDEFRVNTISGRVSVSNIQANDFIIGTVSGRIELYSITSPTVRASTTSGRIDISRVQADEIVLHTVSGRIGADFTQAATLRTNTTSGRHDLSGSFGYINARSTSGRIIITSTIIPESLTARTASGRIDITVPSDSIITVQHSTGSGRFTSDIPVATHSGPDAQFNLSTGSGRITISRL